MAWSAHPVCGPAWCISATMLYALCSHPELHPADKVKGIV